MKLLLRSLKTIIGCFLLVTAFAPKSHAGDIIWNGFASMYARDSLTNGVRDTSTDKNGVGFNDTKFGLNLRSNLNDEWAAVAQIVVSQKSYMPSDETPAWGGEFDWFFLTYRNSEYAFDVKIGRQLFPSTLTSEYVDVGLTYPWRKLPQQFSAIAQFKSFEGVSIGREIQAGDVNMEVRVFGGDGKSQLQPTAEGKLDVNDMVGALVSAEGDGWKLQSVYAKMDLTYSVPVIAPPTTGFTLVENPFPRLATWVVSGKYDRGGLMAYAEYASGRTEDNDSIRVNGYYGTLGYHIGKFLPHYTYSFADWKVDPFINGKEFSHGFGLNYQIDPSILLKAEYLRQFDKDAPVFLNQANDWAESIAVGINVVF